MLRSSSASDDIGNSGPRPLMTAPPFLWQRCAFGLYTNDRQSFRNEFARPHAVLRWAQRRAVAPVQARGPGRAARLSRRRRQGTTRSADGRSGRIRRRPVRDLRALAQEPGDDRGQCRTRVRHRAGRARAAAARPRHRAGRRHEHGVDPVPHRTRGERTGPHLPHGRGHPPLHGSRRAGRGSSYRRRGSHRSGVRDPRCAASGGTALARSGVEPAERVRARRAVPLSVVARHRARPDRSRQGTDPRLQPAENPDRPLASQRTRLLGRCRAQRRAPGRHAFQRPRAEPAFAQSHRQAIDGDPRNQTAWSA